MTRAIPFRKAILCSAVLIGIGLCGCDNSNLSQTFAAIKAIKVDDSGQPPSKTIGKQDVDLAVNTVRDIAVGQGGLLNTAEKSGALKITVVDSLDGSAPARPEENPYTIAQLEAMRALPDLPVKAAADMAAKTETVTPRAAQAPGRMVQVGSFGSVDAAKMAWNALQARHPAAARYDAAFQKITTAAGEPMVRLKVGPVTSDGQARALCDALGVADAWCSRAG